MLQRFISCTRAALILAGTVWMSGASAAQFTASVAGETRTAQLDDIDVQGVTYVSLAGLARQLGGGCRVMPARVQVDLAGKSALAGMNDIKVTAEGQETPLRHPILSREGDALIATADVDAFFSGAFGIGVRLAAAAAPAPPPPTLDDAAMELERDALTSLEAPAPAVQPEPAPVAPSPEPASAAPRLAGTLKSIVLDAGHGGSDPGYAGPGGVQEKDLALAVTAEVARILKETTGLKIYLTRTEDRELSLASRARLAAEQQGDVLVSIHAGVSPSARAHGIQTFYGGRGSALAGRDSRARTAAERIGAAAAASTGAVFRGAREVPLRLASEGAQVVLVEVGFLSNPSEESLLQGNDYRLKLAQGIADGIRQIAEGAR